MPRLKLSEIETIDEAMNTGNGAGYVLTFSDRTFAAYFQDEFGIDIDHERYRGGGSSKGKRLRTFLTVEDGVLAARVLRALWDERSAILARQGREEASGLSDRFFQIVHRLQGDTTISSTDAIDRFSNNETLDELVAAIQRDIGANKPQAALDRLHTYCMKKFAYLIEGRGGACGKDDPLHSRAGKYIKLLETEGALQPISVRIMKSSISIFEEFNNIRNNKSFAHDNEIVGLHEARFIFDSISSVLRFMRSIEASRFGG
ncbi:MAG TPA: abortive infection family protein [Terracidiphilus sp.]